MSVYFLGTESYESPFLINVYYPGSSKKSYHHQFIP